MSSSSDNSKSSPKESTFPPINFLFKLFAKGICSNGTEYSSKLFLLNLCFGNDNKAFSYENSKAIALFFALTFDSFAVDAKQDLPRNQHNF